ncbi:MAG: acyl--CoA ligase [Nitratireductor sp.]|nr:acyl--CoA ligase [Nitratireductor sp.]
MQSIIERFLASRNRHEDKTALVVEEARLTYGELAAQVRDCAAGLSALGVGPDTKLGIVLKNSREFAVTLLAAADLSAVVVPVPPGLGAEALATAMRATDVTHVVGKASAIRPLCSGENPVVEPGNAVLVDGDLPGGHPFGELGGIGERTYQLGANRPRPNQAYILTMTSGSTGDPKPIIFSQDTKIARTKNAIDCYGLTETDVVLAATPMYHSLAQRLFLLPMMLGATSIVMEHFTPARWLDIVREHQVTFTIPVSSQLNAILPLYLEARPDIRCLRVLVSSSAQISLELKQRLSAELDCEFHEIYGTSELGVVSNLAPEHAADKMASVGAPLAGIDVRIYGNEGEVLPAGEIGEIAARSPTVFSGYYNRPEATASAFRDGYFLTGDLGSLDTEGFLHFAGRKKELIITGGINVYPVDIEKVLMETGLLAECAVIGVPDAWFGEAALAVVVPKEPDGFSPRPLQQACRARLSDYQQPLGFEIVDALPRNEMSKIMKPALQQRFAGIDLTARLRGILGGGRVS